MSTLNTPTSLNTKWLAVMGLFFNAFVWGISWWPLKQLQSLGLHPLLATAYVTGTVLVVLFAWLYLRKKFEPAADKSRRQNAPAAPRNWGLLAALLITTGLTNVCFNWAVTDGDVVRVALLFYLMPAWSVPVAWLMLGEKPDVMAMLRLGLALVGVVVVLKTPETLWPVPDSLSDVLALIGGLSFAITNALLLKLKDIPSSSRMLAMFGGGMVVATFSVGIGLAAGSITHAPNFQNFDAAWTPLLALLACFFLLGNLALQFGAARLAAHTTALVMLSELIFASASAVILGASVWNIQTVWGGLLILLAALLSVARHEKIP